MKDKTFSNSALKFAEELKDLGFDKLVFPILIVKGSDLDLVFSLPDFASDADLFYFPFSSDYNLVDSGGHLWTWTYDDKIKTNLPGSFQRTLSLTEVSEIVLKYFKRTRIEKMVKSITETSSSVDELFLRIADKF